MNPSEDPANVRTFAQMISASFVATEAESRFQALTLRRASSKSRSQSPMRAFSLVSLFGAFHNGHTGNRF